MTADAGETPLETPLGQLLKEQIGAYGPMSVSQFMSDCLFHETYGYYTRQAAVGAAGDFITAPEISQVFGELIGLWCAVVWQQMGEPARLHLVEFGPGRGTLMVDALRSAKAVPEYRTSLQVHLVEINATLKRAQRERLGGEAGIAWHDDWPGAETFGGEPVIVIGNEFLDALPIEQVIARDGVWHWREVGLDAADGFAFVEGRPSGHAVDDSVRDGDVREFSEAQDHVADLLVQYAQAGPMASLWIDYGSDVPFTGDTLQGVRQHKYVPPFDAPGETDVTAQVDFSALVKRARDGGLGVDGVVPQAEFLGALGVIERASRLMSANPAQAGMIEAGVARLMAPNGMGTRFKAVGLRSAQLPPLPGFPVHDAQRGSA
ncbi:MAG: SAM-dependent methyltransferase [Hyphomicrobiaceae bacterium]|nr:SAM-dependent methyltransferase [Hyphomicrobiaceae bacterium]